MNLEADSADGLINVETQEIAEESLWEALLIFYHFCNVSINCK
jgi:hypothetical protein